MALVSGVFHVISSLCGRRQNWRLRVKLVRVWNMCSLARPNDPYALQMVFIDEEGEDKGHHFEAAHVHCHSVPIPLSGLSLLKTSDIKKTNDCSDFLLDFMGVLTAVSEEINMNKQDRETRLMLLDLVDEMGSIRCAVFGDVVDVVAGFLNVPRSGLPVVIIHFAKINTYKGVVVGIQNVMNASKISWNPDLPKAIEFKNGLAVHEIETEVDIGSISDRRWVFIVMGIVEEVFKKELVFVLFFCTLWDDVDICCLCSFRFKMKIMVSDGVDCAQLSCLTLNVIHCLTKSCRELLYEVQGHPFESYPTEIMELIGRSSSSKLRARRRHCLTR
ncbi:Nucleic acid-binding, OB-fold [Sesbania bispinosa]|nr:Nucleic acid-binding, OB-fold [Sesbania bispinosa]